MMAKETIQFGYTLSSEEHSAPALVEYAAKAERAGFDFLGLSDHFSPWVEEQGNSPFSWAVAGGVAAQTEKIQLLLEVVCPFMRYHPAIVAQAAATLASMMEGRFLLGVGTGEYLNEHIVGAGWPHIDVRRDMLRDSVAVIRALWEGEYVDHYGKYFTVEKAKIYSLPETPPPIIVSGFGPKAIGLAAEIGDGLVSLAPNKSYIDRYGRQGGKGKPIYGQIHVCFDTDKDRARQTAFKYWPNSGISGQASSELRLPQYFEQAAESIDAETVTKNMVLGDNPEDYQKSVQAFVDAGYTHVYFHQIGPAQEEFIAFWKRRLSKVLRS